MADYEDGPYIVIERRSGGIGAFFWGALIGAGTALLLAPRSGEETRDELRTGVRRLRRRAEDAVREAQDAVLETFDGVKSEVEERIEAARDAFEAGRQAARETRADLDRRVAETRAGFRAGVEAARARESDNGDATDEGAGPDFDS